MRPWQELSVTIINRVHNAEYNWRQRPLGQRVSGHSVRRSPRCQALRNAGSPRSRLIITTVTGAKYGGSCVVAFSLGGGIAMASVANFPSHQLDGSPHASRIHRRLPDEYETICFRYPSSLPSSYLRNLAGRTLGLKVSHSTIGCQMGPEIIKKRR